jgi:GPH family glycoside/pentoside/hexuronide:cation symporter
MAKATGNQQASFGQKTAWGMGGFADYFMASTIVGLAMPIYNIGLGVSAVLVGLAIGLPRILDAITDPLMGYISDNTWSRWGRRRPYIFVGAVLSGILYATVWLAPGDWGEHGLFAYLLITSMLFFVAYTIFAIPHGSLAYEMSSDPHERTTIISYKTFFMALASVLTPWLYWLSLRPIFGNEVVDTDYLGAVVGAAVSGFGFIPTILVGDEVIGMRYVGVLVGIVIISFGVLPAIFCREKENTARQTQPRIEFLDAAKMTLFNRPFLIVTGILLIVLLAFNITFPFTLYINIYHVCDGDKDFASELSGLSASLSALLIIAVLPLIKVLSPRIGKKMTLFLGQLILLLAFLSSFFTYTPEYPYLQFVSVILGLVGVHWTIIMTLSMLSDICDLDEVNTGLRREGMYHAMNAFAVKAGMGGAGVLSGMMVALSGYDPDVKPDVDTIMRMRLLYALVPSAVFVIGFGLTYIYPINEGRTREIRAILDARTQSADDELHDEETPSD